jgi:hypothetical protein
VVTIVFITLIASCTGCARRNSVLCADFKPGRVTRSRAVAVAHGGCAAPNGEAIPRSRAVRKWFTSRSIRACDAVPVPWSAAPLEIAAAGARCAPAAATGTGRDRPRFASPDRPNARAPGTSSQGAGARPVHKRWANELGDSGTDRAGSPVTSKSRASDFLRNPLN